MLRRNAGTVRSVLGLRAQGKGYCESSVESNAVNLDD